MSAIACFSTVSTFAIGGEKNHNFEVAFRLRSLHIAFHASVLCGVLAIASIRTEPALVEAGCTLGF